MQRPITSRTTVDIALLIMIVGLAVAVGKQWQINEQQSQDIERLKTERGQVRISIEAAERLSCLESVLKECKR